MEQLATFQDLMQLSIEELVQLGKEIDLTISPEMEKQKIVNLLLGKCPGCGSHTK